MDFLFKAFDVLSLHREIPFILRFLKFGDYIDRGDILTFDIGGGGGIWSLHCAKKGNRVFLIERAESHTIRARKRFNIWGVNYLVKIYNNYLIDFKPPELADQIIFFEVLEHIMDDETALKIIYGWMKPKAKLLISTPNADQNRPLLWHERISKIEDGGHVRKGYTQEELKTKLEKVGFKVIKMESVGGFFTQQCLNLQHFIQSKLPNSLAVPALLTLLFLPFTILDRFDKTHPDFINFWVAIKT